MQFMSLPNRTRSAYVWKDRGRRRVKVCWYHKQESFYCPLPIPPIASKPPIQFSPHALISHSSSLALTMAQRLDIISDDMSITRGLLGRPDIPLRRMTSFISTSRSAHTREVSNEQDESGGLKDGRRRRMIQSSNTWTVSSGEVFSEQDDVEDRTFFVLEYNRLAMKVCRQAHDQFLQN